MRALCLSYFFVLYPHLFSYCEHAQKTNMPLPLLFSSLLSLLFPSSSHFTPHDWKAWKSVCNLPPSLSHQKFAHSICWMRLHCFFPEWTQQGATWKKDLKFKKLKIKRRKGKKKKKTMVLDREKKQNRILCNRCSNRNETLISWGKSTYLRVWLHCLHLFEAYVQYL